MITAGSGTGGADQGPSDYAVVTAVFARPIDADRFEGALGRLSTEDGVDLLDGVMVDWPDSSAQPCWRAARNVARFGALSPTTWDDHVRRLALDEGEATRQLRRGAIAAVLVVETRHGARLVDDLRADARTVSVASLAGDEYRRLRSHR